MTRAYVRVDPTLVDRLMSKGYPDGAITTYLSVLCAAESQQPRGRFRNKLVLLGFLNRRHHRYLGFLLAHGSIVSMSDGTYYVDGWDEWQEGNILVAERMRQIRNKRELAPKVTADVPELLPGSYPPKSNADVTPSSELARVLSGKPLAVSGKHPAPVRERPEGAGESLIYDEETNAILGAFMELTGRAGFSGEDLGAAQGFLVECPRQSAQHITERMEQYATWRRENGHKPCRRLMEYRDTLVKEEAFLADSGVKKSRRSASSYEMSSLGDALKARVS